MLAAAQDQCDCASVLVEAGADVNATNEVSFLGVEDDVT